MKENILKNKSIEFALDIVKLAQKLQDTNKEFVLSKQILRSGTSIGALIHESIYGQSKADFINKLNIALKEANETSYWLIILNRSGYIEDSQYNNLDSVCNELISILIASIKTTKKNISNTQTPK